EIVRRVSTTKAYVSFKGRLWKVPQAFRGERLAIRPSANDAQYGIFFAARQIAIIDLASGESVGYVPEHPSVMSPG
ncbi:IS481 family transposase, partial [Bradyrhizobium zhanjiangense]